MSRKSFDEPRPNLQTPHELPSVTVRRSSSFNVIKEDEDDEGPSPDFMKDLGIKVSANAPLPPPPPPNLENYQAELLTRVYGRVRNESMINF